MASWIITCPFETGTNHTRRARRPDAYALGSGRTGKLAPTHAPVLVLGIGVAERVGLPRTYSWQEVADRDPEQDGAGGEDMAGRLPHGSTAGREPGTTGTPAGWSTCGTWEGATSRWPAARAQPRRARPQGFPVPAGFVVTTAAYDRFVAHNRLAGTIARALRTDPDGGAATSRKPRSGPAATGGLPWACGPLSAPAIATMDERIPVG